MRKIYCKLKGKSYRFSFPLLNSPLGWWMLMILWITWETYLLIIVNKNIQTWIIKYVMLHLDEFEFYEFNKIVEDFTYLTEISYS